MSFALGGKVGCGGGAGAGVGDGVGVGAGVGVGLGGGAAQAPTNSIARMANANASHFIVCTPLIIRN